MDINWFRDVNLKIKYIACRLDSTDEIRLYGGHNMITFNYPISIYSHVQIFLTDVDTPTLSNVINNINQDNVDKYLNDIFNSSDMSSSISSPIISFQYMRMIGKSTFLSLLDIPIHIQGFILLRNL